MLFAVIFRDQPGHGELRARLLADHIAWLDEHREVVRVGGSLRTEPDTVPVGGLWIVNAPDKAQVGMLMRSDPFFREGLRASWEVLHWCKAFEERYVPV